MPKFGLVATKAKYDDLKAGKVSGHTYDSNKVYFVNTGANDILINGISYGSGSITWGG